MRRFVLSIVKPFRSVPHMSAKIRNLHHKIKCDKKLVLSSISQLVHFNYFPIGCICLLTSLDISKNI